GRFGRATSRSRGRRRRGGRAGLRDCGAAGPTAHPTARCWSCGCDASRRSRLRDRSRWLSHGHPFGNTGGEMTATYDIREATPADAPALHELGAAVTWPTYAPIAGAEYAAYVMDTWWRSDYIAESMSRTTHYVAER